MDELWNAGSSQWICGCHGIVWPNYAAKETHKEELRVSRHLAAFFGDCGMKSCEICEARREG